jgi:molybdopterin converting factor small subunit
MTVTVKLFATFRVGRFAAETRAYPAGSRVADVISRLHLPATQIGMIMLNSRHAEPEEALNDGDNVSIFPLVGGG